MSDATADPLDIDGPAAPPRANGELVFTAPWQSRLFATTMRLHEAEHFQWDAFRDRLIAKIVDHERELDDPQCYDYWGCWQRALEDLLDELQLVSRTEVAATSDVLAARPADHDHDHDQDHSHDDGHGHGDHGRN